MPIYDHDGHAFANEQDKEMYTAGLKRMTGYKEVFVNTVNLSDAFSDVSDAARNLTMDVLQHYEKTGNAMDTQEVLDFWDRAFDMVWQKRMGLGKSHE